MTQQMNKQDFLDRIYDYEQSEEWIYKGETPAVIDFYADWCAPCRMVGPVMDELSDEYQGRVSFFKVDTAAEEELSAAFGIRSIPSILFIPKEGRPLMATGALPKRQLKEIIDSELLGEKPAEPVGFTTTGGIEA